MNNHERFIVLNETKNFVGFMNEIIVNYPKKSYVLRDKIEKTSYEVLELVYYTNMITNRLDYQKRILAKISVLDYYLELSYAKKFISLKKMNQGSRMLENIRKLMYGWIQSNESTV